MAKRSLRRLTEAEGLPSEWPREGGCKASEGRSELQRVFNPLVPS